MHIVNCFKFTCNKLSWQLENYPSILSSIECKCQFMKDISKIRHSRDLSLEKLGPVKTDLVGIDPNWEDWKFDLLQTILFVLSKVKAA